MFAFTVLGEIGFVPVWCNSRVCLGGIPNMAAWSDDGRLFKLVTLGSGCSSNYVAKKTVLTSSGRSSVIAEDVVIHEHFLLEFWRQNGYCQLPAWRMLWRNDGNLNRHTLRFHKQYWNICTKKAKIQIFNRKLRPNIYK
jgi:hypothetical protein